ncbi:MAG: YgaP family membrane protein [Ferrimicrobium sp.]
MELTRNMGSIDRWTRVIVATPISLGLALLVGVTSVWSSIFYLIAAVMLITATFGYCPLYQLLGRRTTVGCFICKEGSKNVDSSQN